jgi:hypothetical protein
MRLELRLGLQTLVAGVGHGRLGWFIQALRCDMVRTLGLEPALVDVREVYEAKEGCLTVVECVVSVPASHGRLSLTTAASDLMDQCERNRERVDDADDLMKLVSHVDVKGHGSSRLQWSFAQVVLVAAIVAAMAHYYGAFAFGAGAPALGLRGGMASTTSSMGRRPAAAPRTAVSQPTSVRQEQTPHTRRLQGGSALQLHMPMLTCSGCHVARFCSADHQKMASKKAAMGGSLRMGRHKDICGVLGKWREVVKDLRAWEVLNFFGCIHYNLVLLHHHSIFCWCRVFSRSVPVSVSPALKNLLSILHGIVCFAAESTRDPVAEPRDAAAISIRRLTYLIPPLCVFLLFAASYKILSVSARPDSNACFSGGCE